PERQEEFTGDRVAHAGPIIASSLFVIDSRSKRELRRQLKEPRRRRRLDVAERRARDVAVDRTPAVELRGIEEVEHFEPDLEGAPLVQRHALDQREIDVLDAGPVEKPPGRVAELTERRQAEAGRVEGGAVPRIAIELQIAARCVVRRVNEVVVDAVAERPE